MLKKGAASLNIIMKTLSKLQTLLSPSHVILIPAFIDRSPTPARLECNENNPGSMECSCLDRYHRHRGLSRRS